LDDEHSQIELCPTDEGVLVRVLCPGVVLRAVSTQDLVIGFDVTTAYTSSRQEDCPIGPEWADGPTRWAAGVSVRAPVDWWQVPTPMIAPESRDQEYSGQVGR
jgi:hypothetical protein